SVDTGIRARQVVEHARELGLDIIITDHHLPEEGLPRANAVLNPKRRDCNYPNKNLAGCGVAFKLAQALFIETNRAHLVEPFIKIAAIGTIADIVPLVGENRVIAKFGLAGLSRPNNPGLRALLEVARVAVIAGHGWHRGVIGIVASKVVEHLHRPTIIISIENGLGHGSGRSIAAFHLLDGLESCTELFERFGGHSHAAGMAIAADRI